MRLVFRGHGRLTNNQTETMKKLLTALCLTCVLALAAHAQEGETK
jgi:hypothetical protein